MTDAPTLYALAARDRLLDRPRCSWPEVAIIGDAGSAHTITLAAVLRRGGIATSTYFAPIRRQLKRAIADDPDFVLFADTLKMRDCVTGAEWLLNPEHPAKGALFAAICRYLPLSLGPPERPE